MEPDSARLAEDNIGRNRPRGLAPAPLRASSAGLASRRPPPALPALPPPGLKGHWAPAGSGPAALALFLIRNSERVSPGPGGFRPLITNPFMWIFVATTRRKRNRRSPRSPSSASVSRTSLRRSSGRSPQAHREWLLEQHGPVCAYCGTESQERTITLDHVTPRRGKSAYDRPDNLVLACRTCNAEKADKPLLAFLLAKRSRGVFLAHYGEHLSEPLRDLARKASERPISPA